MCLDMTKTQSLRMISKIPPGRGKAIMINTILTKLRTVLCETDAVHVNATTGVAIKEQKKMWLKLTSEMSAIEHLSLLYCAQAVKWL